MMVLLLPYHDGHGGNDEIVIRREIYVCYHVLLVGRRGQCIHIYSLHSLCL